jgi:D-3-phosphoglycerate dehydrogenase
LFEADPRTRAGEWGIKPLRPIRRFSDLTVGLIGYGRIARRLAGSLRALDATVLAHDPYVTRTDETTTLVDLAVLLARSDIVSLHVPMSAATRGLVNHAALQRMRPGSMLVNTSRGGLVVFDDLVTALRAGQLAGAALDVFEHEPPDRLAFADVPNLLVTPHMAYYSEESLAESQRKAATQVVKVLRGEPPDYPVVASA